MNRSLVLLLVVGLVFVALVFGLEKSPNREQPERVQPTDAVNNQLGETVKVSRVFDGDTIQVASGRLVRYIGIDTPEIDSEKKDECFAQEAMAKNRQLVEGQKVLLEKDVSDKDTYGRLLRYVYVETDKPGRVFVNDYLVRGGFAKALSIPPNLKHKKEFEEAEAFARQSNLGLWGGCQSASNPSDELAVIFDEEPIEEDLDEEKICEEDDFDCQTLP